MLVMAPTLAHSAYSPPLTEVRIDRDVTVHSPSLVYVSENRTTVDTDLRLSGFGAQYIGQFEWSSGYGLQVGAAIGPGQVDGSIVGDDGLSLDTSGFWVAGQLRAYKMVWKSEVDESEERPSALTLFVNLRGFHYSMEGSENSESVELSFSTLTGGVGAMAEISVSDYISVCPYAWLTPGVASRLDVRATGRDPLIVDGGPTLRNPFLVGVDIWIYTSPPNWNDHVSLSILGSFIDTEGDDRTIAAVVSYTF